MTLGAAAAARVRLIVWCRDYGPQVEPELARHHGTNTAVLGWRKRLVCSRRGSRKVDMVVSGTERRQRT
jgi:hypothetical protein